MIWSMKQQNYDKNSHAMLAIFYVYFRKKVRVLINWTANFTLNTTTCTARTAHGYSSVHSLHHLYQKNQLSLDHYVRNGKKEIFSVNTTYISCFSINLLLHTFPFFFVFVLPDVLFKMTRFFIGSMAIKTFVWSVSIIHKIIVKIILEELAIPWDWLEKTCTQIHTHKGKINWQSYFKAAIVWRANIGKKWLNFQYARI